MKVKSFMWLALAVCLPGLIVSCSKKQAGDASQAGAGAAGAYKTMTVERSDKEFTRTYSATIRGRQDVSVMPQVSGTLTQVLVNEGEAVRRGTDAIRDRSSALSGGAQSGPGGRRHG